MLCVAESPKRMRDIICMGERRMQNIRRYVPWEALYYDPANLFMVWTGFRQPTVRDQSFIAEMSDIRNANDAKSWELFMQFWRHYAGLTSLPLSSIGSPRAGADSD